MGILRRIASWRMGFALIFMCVTTVGFFRNALTPELEATDAHVHANSNSTFVFKPSKSGKSSKKHPIAGSHNTSINNDIVAEIHQNPRMVQDIKAKLGEMAREKLGAAFQGVHFDDSTLQWIANSGKVDDILFSLKDIAPEQWGNALSNLKMKDLGGAPEHLVGRPHDDNLCEFGNCNT